MDLYGRGRLSPELFGSRTPAYAEIPVFFCPFFFFFLSLWSLSTYNIQCAKAVAVLATPFFAAYNIQITAPSVNCTLEHIVFSTSLIGLFKTSTGAYVELTPAMPLNVTSSLGSLRTNLEDVIASMAVIKSTFGFPWSSILQSV